MNYFAMLAFTSSSRKAQMMWDSNRLSERLPPDALDNGVAESKTQEFDKE